MDKIDFDFLLQLLREDYTYNEISMILKESYPGMRGLSTPSVKLYCQKNNLSTKYSNQEVENIVVEAVDEVRRLFILIRHKK